MTPVLLVSDLRLADGAYSAEVLRVGHWDYPGLEGGLTVTPPLLKELQANFASGAKGFEVPIDGPSRGGEAHSNSDLHDCGWVKALRVSADGSSLLAELEITNPEVRQMVDEGSLRYVSSELDLAWFDPEDKSEKQVFEGLSLTNRPYIKRMQPIRPIDLTEKRGDDPPTQLQEEPMADEAKVSLAEFETMKAALAEKDKQAAALSARLDEVVRERRLGQIKARLSGLVKRGKLTRPAYMKQLRLAEVLLAYGGGTTIQLSARVRLSEDAAEEVDKIDVLDEMMDTLSQLPDGIATESDDEVVLEDDEDAPAKSGDEYDEIDRLARMEMKSKPGLSYTEAVLLAEKRRSPIRSGGNRR